MFRSLAVSYTRTPEHFFNTHACVGQVCQRKSFCTCDVWSVLHHCAPKTLRHPGCFFPIFLAFTLRPSPQYAHTATDNTHYAFADWNQEYFLCDSARGLHHTKAEQHLASDVMNMVDNLHDAEDTEGVYIDDVNGGNSARRQSQNPASVSCVRSGT